MKNLKYYEDWKNKTWSKVNDLCKHPLHPSNTHWKPVSKYALKLQLLEEKLRFWAITLNVKYTEKKYYGYEK